MDKKVFSVYLGDPDRSNHAELDLPATPWELIDALDKLRVEDGREPYWQVEDIGRYGFLAPLLDDSDLYQFNALAEQLSTFDHVEAIVFEGLVQMEVDELCQTNGGELTLQRNINYGVDSAAETVRAFPEFGDRLDVNEALDVLCSRKCINPFLDMESFDEEISDEERKLETARVEVTESLRYLIGNISRIMDYYISRHTDTNFDSIVCCGLGARVKGLMLLLTNELGQQVDVLQEFKNFALPAGGDAQEACLYAAVLSSGTSGVNLMDKVNRKEKKETLSGAIIICVVGTVAGVVLTVAGYANRIYQQHEQERLNQRISEESSIEEIYSAYTSAKAQYDNYQNMYQYTNTPNEGLKNFIEELEEKMPSDITVENFSSTGTQVSFSMRVGSKSAAANTIMQLRTFESLSTVTTTGIDEAEDGTVSLSVLCTYSDPAPLDSSGE